MQIEQASREALLVTTHYRLIVIELIIFVCGLCSIFDWDWKGGRHEVILHIIDSDVPIQNIQFQFAVEVVEYKTSLHFDLDYVANLHPLNAHPSIVTFHVHVFFYWKVVLLKIHFHKFWDTFQILPAKVKNGAPARHHHNFVCGHLRFCHIQILPLLTSFFGSLRSQFDLILSPHCTWVKERSTLDWTDFERWFIQKWNWHYSSIVGNDEFLASNIAHFSHPTFNLPLKAIRILIPDQSSNIGVKIGAIKTFCDKEKLRVRRSHIRDESLFPFSSQVCRSFDQFLGLSSSSSLIFQRPFNFS